MKGVLMSDSKAERYMKAAIKGATWLCGKQSSDGAITPSLGLAPMYKDVAALTVTGRAVEASRLLNWLTENALIRPGEYKLTFSQEQTSAQPQTSFYPNVWIMLGALKLMRFDVASQTSLKHLMGYQHDCGGFAKSLPSDGFYDLLCTAMGGWIALSTGRLAQAEKAGKLLIKMADLQPETDKLYFVYDEKRKDLICEIPENRRAIHVIDLSDSKQHFYQSGIAMVLLSDLYKTTGKREYLDAAENVYFPISAGSNEESFTWPSKCKDGWGAALLYHVTGNPKHRALAEKVADRTFIDAQQSDGSWKGFYAPFSDDFKDGADVSPEELTAEFIFELFEIAKCIA